MNITEKAAYLKGLAEGLAIDPASKEGKLLLAIVDILDDMALTVADMDDEVAELAERVDEIDEDLASVESDFYEDEDEDDDEEDDEFYEVECPSCGEEIYVDEDILEDEKVVCPNCGQEIDLELECNCDDDTCDCH
jgi:DNA-directed RNA polymerase subunit RPC12/RpoP